MKNIAIFNLIFLFLLVSVGGCTPTGPVVYYDERDYRGKYTFSFKPSFGNPTYKKGWRDEERSVKNDDFRRAQRYAYDLGRWEAQMGVPFLSIAGRHFAEHEDGYNRSRGRRVTSKSQLNRLMEEKGELDALADTYGYHKKVYRDVISDPYYKRGYSDEIVNYDRDNERRERTYNRQASQWIADMHEWEAERDPRIDSSREYERLMHNLGVLHFKASKYGYPPIEYPTKK